MSLPVKALVSALLAVAATIAEEALKETPQTLTGTKETGLQLQEQRRTFSSISPTNRPPVTSPS